MHTIDWEGLSMFTGSIIAGIVSLATLGMQLWTFARQQRDYNRSLLRDQTLNTIDKNVNGLNKTIADTSHAAGRAEGILIGAGIKANVAKDDPT